MYGITIEQFEEMHQAQDGLCAICLKPPSEKQPYLAVDHNHKTGAVRALLCGKCNMVIGGCEENPARLMKMMEYITYWNSEQDIDDVGTNWSGNALN